LHFGKPYRNYIDEFEVFIKQPIPVIMKILPS
jgi:hypothetical protein